MRIPPSRSSTLRSLMFAFALLGTFALVSVVQAQPAEPRPIRFTVFALRPIAGLEFSRGERMRSEKLTFYPTARSPRYEYGGTMPLRFRDERTGEDVAEVVVPNSLRDVLLLFLPAEAGTPGGRRFQIAVLDDSPAGEGLAIVNLSGLALSGAIGDHAIALKSGLNPRLPLVPGSMSIVLQTRVRERVYRAYADQLELSPGERALLILFPPYYPGSIEVQARMLIDRPAAPDRPSSGAR